ncbi:MAG: class I SAM-dependent methyltransferase [Candidatus Thorarchaeota archaeon]
MNDVDDDKYKDVHFIPQEVTLESITREGYILDIGGGGEGIIGQLEGERVVAIDIREDELKETVDGFLKIIMDAKDLKFLDASFSTVTAFFSMMYMNSDDKAEVMKEIHRVLKPGGELLLWDLVVPARFDESKTTYAIFLKIHLPNKTIQTGYGCPWEHQTQDASQIKDIALTSGLEIIEENVEEHKFYFRFKKPSNE